MTEGVTSRCSDLRNAELLVARHGNDPRQVGAWSKWLWDGKRWRVDDTGGMMRRAANTARALLFRTDARRAKTFFSSPKDDYRPAYHRREREQVRECVFAGSVNLCEYLRDPTGNRRFGPARCTRIDTDALHRDRDQIWAEARWLYQNGAAWHPTGEEVELAAQEQAERVGRVEDTDSRVPAEDRQR